MLTQAESSPSRRTSPGLGFTCRFAAGGRPPTEIARAVAEGLGAPDKRLLIRFHDAREHVLLRRLERRPEHDGPRLEAAILDRHADDIAAAGSPGQVLLEVGPERTGSTAPLVAAILTRQRALRYLPVGATPSALRLMSAELRKKFPAVDVQGLAGRYETGIAEFFADDPPPALVSILGGCLERLRPSETREILAAARRRARPFDLLLVGFPLRHDVSAMRAAFDDGAGAAARFAFESLRRVNRLLGGRFQPAKFAHVAEYNAAESRVETFLESRERQLVWIEHLDRYYSFEKGERILTGAYQRFGKRPIAEVCALSGWSILHQWTDGKGRFAVVLLAPGANRGLVSGGKAPASA